LRSGDSSTRAAQLRCTPMLNNATYTHMFVYTHIFVYAETAQHVQLNYVVLLCWTSQHTHICARMLRTALHIHSSIRLYCYVEQRNIHAHVRAPTSCTRAY